MEIPSPVDAATIILARHGEPVGAPWQVFMVRRPIKSDFAADVYVFPGGKVDHADYDAASRVLMHDGLAAYETSLDTMRAVRAAAVREVFEETGILLAGPDGGEVRTDDDPVKWDRYRRAVIEGRLRFAEMLRDENLAVHAHALHAFSRWITPPIFRRRYDTRFFVAYMPHGQTPVPEPTEIVESTWVAPGDALARYYEGRFPLVFATEKHLEMLDRFRSIEELVASTAGADLRPVVPERIGEGPELRFMVPERS